MQFLYTIHVLEKDINICLHIKVFQHWLCFWTILWLSFTVHNFVHTVKFLTQYRVKNLNFFGQFVRPSTSTYIRVYQSNGVLMESIDAMSSAVVYPQSTSGRQLTFTTSYNYQRGITYNIRFDEGITKNKYLSITKLSFTFYFLFHFDLHQSDIAQNLHEHFLNSS